MIFITAKFRVLPEHADEWPEISREFTEACRAEDGCLWFDWSRSLDDPNEYVLVEAFRDGDAGGAHVQSDALQAGPGDLPPYLAATPRIVNFEVPGTTGPSSARWPSRADPAPAAPHLRRWPRCPPSRVRRARAAAAPGVSAASARARPVPGHGYGGRRRAARARPG